MTKTYCDRCKTLIEEKFIDMVNLYVYSHEDVNNATHSLDLCPKCGDELIKLLEVNSYLPIATKENQ